MSLDDVEHPRPNHVGLILDGNRRWARARGLSHAQGHEAGAIVARKTVERLLARDVPNVTLYAFSAQNWTRPKDEIDSLMRIVRQFSDDQRPAYVESGVRVVVVGDLDELPTPTRRSVERLVEETERGARMTLALALSYGGRRDMVDAMRAIAVRARAGLLIPEEIDESSLRTFLSTSPMPDPELIIRTGGERRLSDFLLFEAAYAELYFTETMWPDFDEATLDHALAAFGRSRARSRRTPAPPLAQTG